MHYFEKETKSIKVMYEKERKETSRYQSMHKDLKRENDGYREKIVHFEAKIKSAGSRSHETHVVREEVHHVRK